MTLLVIKICHFTASKNARLSEILADELEIDSNEAFALISLGAVYLWKRRLKEDWWIRQGDYLRVHRNPTRFFTTGIDWKSRILLNEVGFIAIYKPPGLPTHMAVDNIAENAQAQLESFLGMKLFTTHRLDTLSEGILLFGKTAGWAKQINQAFSRGRVQKIYRTFLESPLFPMSLEHYMESTNCIPKQLYCAPSKNRKLCRLTILDSTPTLLKGARVYETTIALLTGRTHQIRAQLAKSGLPIIGDILYGSPVSSEHFQLKCAKLELTLNSKKYLIEA